MRVLITGIGGFAGSHLAELCLARGDVEVLGTVRRDPAGTGGLRLGHVAHLAERLRLVEADMRDARAVERVVRETQPEIVFHLAGQAAVPLAFQDPAGTFLDNAVGQLHLILAILRHQPAARLLVVGSATEYGRVEPDEDPVDEGAPLRPVDPYAVSKVAQDLSAYQYYVSHQLQAVRVRPFNHIGPRQGTDFAIASFARQIAAIEAGLAPPEMLVGNLSAVRDFTDVRDMVRAYWLAATQGRPGEVYNLGSGRGRRIDELLATLADLSRVRFAIRQDPARLRPADMRSFVCNAARFRADTGWSPQIPVEQTLRDTLDYWRGRVR
jgi:GDP-4-dehydro-6-deoxy-D-mannose reductase